ncbi:MAG: PQQ-binding-like beta-propeller repeat protein [Fimbriiglobus sp.]
MPRLFAVFAITVAVAPLRAADWPQFLGPTRDSASAETVAPWTAPPKVLWKQPVGEAHSSPIVADGVVYAFFKPREKDADALAAFDAKTGEKKWERSYEREKAGTPFGAGPRGTPTVADGAVYTFGPTGVLAKWDTKTGEIAWKVDTLKEFHAKNLFFGASTSPTVVGKTVVVMVGGKGAGIVGIHTRTGKTAWTVSDDPASYASPLTVGTGEATNLVFLTGSHLRAVSASGKDLWAVPFQDKLNESSTTPVKFGDTIVASSVTAGSLTVKPGTAIPETVWKDGKLSCYFSTPVVVGKHLYMVTAAGSFASPAVHLKCVEAATGKVLWTRENVGKYHAALLRTGDDKLLMLDDRGGLALLQPDPTAFRELATAKVCGPTWAHPALADGRLYLRDDKHLIALELAAK